MTRRLIARTLRTAIAATWLLLIAPAAAWAQGGAGVPTKEEKGISYVVPYALTLLGIGLGLLVLARPSRRPDPSADNKGPA